MNHDDSTNAPGNGPVVIGDDEEDDCGDDHEDEYVRGPSGNGSWSIGSANSQDWSTMGWQFDNY